MKIEDKLATSGERLKRARILAGLNTRREFEQKFNISSNTLQGWEQGKNPLSEKGARRVVEALKQQGLLCTVEWLMKGSGMPPRPYEMVHAGIQEPLLHDQTVAELNLKEEESIYQESQLFKQQNPNSIIINIVDDAMEPYFRIGDYIGGIQVPNEDIANFIGNVCILELENNVILARLLQAGTEPGRFTAAATNPLTAAAPLNLYNVKVISAAPVVWQRCKLTALKKQ
jgi:transcriptional regulator with XRE-family HTH domain